MPDSARQERLCPGRHPGRRGNAGRDDRGSGRARARFPGGRAAAGGSERASRRAGNRPVQDRRSASPQDWVPRRREQRRLRGPAPRHRPLLAGDQLLNPVVDGTGASRSGSWPWSRRPGGQRWRRRGPGSLSVSRTRGRRDHGERDSRQAPGTRAACPAGRAASIRCPPSWAMSSRPGPDPRPWCRPPRASTGTLTRCCLPAWHENVLQALLCTTMWITCAKRRRACARIGKCWGLCCRAAPVTGPWRGKARPRPVDGERTELSTRHAAIAHK